MKGPKDETTTTRRYNNRNVAEKHSVDVGTETLSAPKTVRGNIPEEPTSVTVNGERYDYLFI
jgi:hypothetical protein